MNPKSHWEQVYQTKSPSKSSKRLAANSVVGLSFIVALEFVIMISPFAVYFYTAFNPLLLALDKSWMTRWLTAFFLPHMVIPPNGALKVVRILGSWFFIGGMAVFLVCALQVYVGKLLKTGVAARGLYALIRHPQYVGLAVAALGLAIMWPRFLTLTLFAVMLFLYYLLAKDEERRMLDRFGNHYIPYRERTGMFLPRFVERLLTENKKSEEYPRFGKAIVMLAMLLVVCVGSGFLLRAYTVHHLPLERASNVDVITITKDDLTAAQRLLPSVVEDFAVARKLQSVQSRSNHRLLAYFIPVDYMMQGMIADTGEEWKLFEHHKTIGMITEYILHPFTHLTGGHAHHMASQHHDASMHNSPAMKRRIIFLDVSADHRELSSPLDDFDINIRRVPLFFVDVHLHTGEILQVRDTPTGSGWGTVPTPMF
jgi:protein-S-isoprenylcysteine O-methyltransferase Ste14